MPGHMPGRQAHVLVQPIVVNSQNQGRSAPQKKRAGGGGGGNFIFVALLLIAAGFIAATYYFHGSPQELWNRLAHSVENLIHPSPPTPSPTPTPPPASTPPPRLVATPAPSAPDPMAWLMGHPQSQPKQVTLLESVAFPVLFNGRVAGSARLPAGSLLKVIKIDGAALIPAYGEATSPVPVQSTDLLQRTLVEMAKPPPPPDTPRPAPAAAISPLTATPSPAAGETILEQLAQSSGEHQQSAASGAFIHPGLLHTDADFHRMKNHLYREPWKSGWEKLIANPHASLTWNPRPVPVVERGRGDVPENYARLFNDIAAAYACALRWRISGDVAYAKKAVQVMNAWSSTLKQVSGTSDRFLAAGIYGYEFANAAEIMRTYHGWEPEDLARFQQMMLTVFYPMNHDFLLRHNGAAPDHYWANWDLCNMASEMAIGVLCDNRAIYEDAVHYFKYGNGNGSINHAVVCIHDGGLGQWQESGRDQGHTMMGMGLYGAICQMAWNQGDDLFGYGNNRFLAAAEYVAKYNLGEDVPFTPYANSSFRNEVISPAARGNERPVWDLIYNHYVLLKGLAAPYVTKFAEKSRPEGGGGDYGPNSGGFDQLGYGTLTFTLDPADLPQAFEPSP